MNSTILEALNYAVDRFGAEAALTLPSGEATVRAFVQPVTSFDKRTYRQVVTGAGLVSEMRYLYIGPAAYDLTNCEAVACGGRRFEVLSAETVLAGGEVCYCWAVLRRMA